MASGGQPSASNDPGVTTQTATHVTSSVAVDERVITKTDKRASQIREARQKGYEGDNCGECGNFTLVRNGTCMKCVTCGATSGCS